MKLLCPYSGIAWRAEHFSGHSNLQQHPIFNLSARQLLSKSKGWNADKFSRDENKLLLIALLKATESVDFRHFADPSPSIVSQNMEKLFLLLGNADLISDGTIMLPKFSVTSDSFQLDSLHNWIEQWNDAKDEWLSPAHRLHMQQKLESRELVLNKLIHSPYKQTEQYAGRLASWAMDAGSVPESLREYWTTLFKLKDKEIYSARLVDIEELIEHMETELYVSTGGNQYADRVLFHLRKIRERVKTGRMGELTDGSFYSIIDDEDLDGSGNNGANSTEIYNAKLAAANAPAEKPDIKNYSGRLMSYMRDNAAWTLAQNLKKTGGVS